MGRGIWGFPKGIVDPGETPEETALKEAEEEAGLLGRIEGDPVAEYEYRKWGTLLLVSVYLMQVTTVEDEWDEADLRRRKWFGAEEARAAVGRPEVQEAFERALDHIRSRDRGDV
jgi:phosphohistidine phosphatase